MSFDLASTMAAPSVSAPADWLPTTAARSENKAISETAGPHHWQIQPWARLVRRLWRQRAYTRWVERACSSVEVQGLERLADISGPCIFIANHQSHLDTLVAYTAMPEAIKRKLFFGAAADRWYRKGQKKTVLKPWYQSLILGNFPIVRGGGSKTLNYAKWLLSKGEHIFVFPEGTRGTARELGQFRPGVALMAKELGVTVVPVYLSGLKEIRPKGAKDAVPGAAGVEFLEPLRFSAQDSITTMTARMRGALSRAHERYLVTRAVERAEAPVEISAPTLEAANDAHINARQKQAA
jgi:1-acyl-sn-glycerol-3-phosphate acyltransferase